MSSTVVRVDNAVHAKLRRWSESQDKSIGEVVADLVEHQEQEQFWAEMRAGYERLRADPAAWQDYLDEIALWDGTSMDGFKEERFAE
jgi:hypothetical protein